MTDKRKDRHKSPFALRHSLLKSSKSNSSYQVVLLENNMQRNLNTNIEIMFSIKYVFYLLYEQEGSK